jgi:hypothetical protein
MLKLLLNCVHHSRVTVTQTGHCSATRGIKVTLALAVKQLNASPFNHDRKLLSGQAMKDI